MFYRENGQYKSTYASDQQMLPILQDRVFMGLLLVLAFVAAGLPQFSLTSRLVFMVVGPVLDLKLLSMQAGTFGRSFARVFAPVSFLVAIASAVLIGTVLL